MPKTKDTTQKDTTKIEWTATLLPPDADINWVRGLGLEVIENPLILGQFLVLGYTFNPWIGCTKWGTGCLHCYAENLMDTRYGRVEWGRGNPRKRTAEANWRKPLTWNRKAQALYDRYSIRLKVFCGSLCDWADSEVEQAWRDDLFTLIDQCPALDWLMLTKRLEVKPWERLAGEPISSGNHRIASIVPRHWTKWPENIWFGHSVSCQRDADILKQEFSSIPAPKKFISYEPATEQVDWSGLEFIDWLICGGESGLGARAYDWEWGRVAYDWCQNNGIKFFMKQTGSDPYWTKESPLGFPVTGKGGNPEQWPEPLPREYLR